MEGLRDECISLFDQDPNLAPGSDSRSAAYRVTMGLDIHSTYFDNSNTLALIRDYIRYTISYPLLYTAFIRHRLDNEDVNNDDDAAHELLVGISNGPQFLLMTLKERENTLNDDVTTIKKNKMIYGIFCTIFSIVVLAMTFTAAVTASVVSMPKAALITFAAINLLCTTINVAQPWLDFVHDKKLNDLKRLIDTIRTMRRGCSYGRLRLPTIWKITAQAENVMIERAGLRAAKMTLNRVGNTAAGTSFAPLEREVAEKKMELSKAIDGLSKVMDRFEEDVKKQAIHFLNAIAY